MISKLTSELEKEIRGNLEACGPAPYVYAEELLSEIDCLRSQIKDLQIKEELLKSLPLILKLMNNSDFIKKVNEKGYQVDIEAIRHAFIDVATWKGNSPFIKKEKQ